MNPIVLSCTAKTQERLVYVANALRTVGVELDKGYKSGLGKMQFKTELIEVVDKETKRKKNISVYKLGLTKIPELYAYTDPDSALVVAPLDEGE